jgi:hypothetical protein
MTVDSTCPSRETRKVARPAAGVVEVSALARRRDRQEPRSMPVQQVGRDVVDAPTAAMEDASLATLRCCQPRDHRRATLGRPCCCCRCYYYRFWGWGHEGEGLPENMVVPAVVGAEAVAAAEGTLHLRARSRTRWPVLGTPSGPARSPRVRGRCERCRRRGTTATA